MIGLTGYAYVALMQAVIDQAKRDAIKIPKKSIDFINRDEAICFFRIRMV